MKYIFGNWKMNNTSSDVKKFKKIFKDLQILDIQFGLALPFPYLNNKIENCLVGAQNVSNEEKGAFTGEVSANMLKDLNLDFCLVGHSERRKMGEKNKEINQKIFRLLEKDILPVLCIGETLKEKEENKTEEILKKQILADLKGVDSKNIMIAYEPVWAIGTGKTPTKDEVVETIKFIKQIVKDEFNFGVKVLYGGSVKPENAKQLVGNKFVDGALVGGASLNAETFINIAKGQNK